jgi:hypothetical protein
VNDIKLKDATLDDIMDEVRERYSWAGVGCGLTPTCSCIRTHA